MGVDNRIMGKCEVSAKDTANILMTTIADYVEQMVDMNGWRDHHQIETPNALYPGDGKPAVAFYWLSSVCRAIKGHLNVVPDIFEKCTRCITYANECDARDAYWKVTIEEKSLTVEQQMELLVKCIELNPFVGEPHILLAQLYFRVGKYKEAAIESVYALNKMYTLAIAWDKRRSYENWVGFSRLTLKRSQRRLQGLTSFPTDSKAVSS